ncbi:MAG: hypothetical protein HY815_20795 [Candidatus Riflebacteria bacterium]|nr:hypothetical protein [Candidatus Riflebacteria bacterium]
MRVVLMLALTLSAVGLAGCANGDLFPNAPNNSFINTSAIGPGPHIPPTPISGHTFSNPTGR